MDLDDDGLRATRKLNGADKGEVVELDKAKKNLSEIINLCEEDIQNNDRNVTAVLNLTDLLSLRNLIKAYKELEENNIPVSLVEEKIEELEDEICGDDEYLGNRQCIELELLEKVQKELLEKR